MKPRRAALLALAVATPAFTAGLDTLGIGPRYAGGRLVSGSGWQAIVDTSSYVQIDAESVWTPTVDVAGDLVAPASGYGQAVRYWPEGGLAWSTLGKAAAMMDDDGTTAYAPDEQGEPRTRALLIDLGAVFGINRVRLHPRMDRGHQRLFLQEFSLSSSTAPGGPYQELLSFSAALPNVEPIVDRLFPSRFARYLYLVPAVERAWEIAEIEAYSDGTLPVGELVTQVFTVGYRISDRRDILEGQSAVIWGRVRYEGGLIETAPVLVQTRTGTQENPRIFYMRLVANSEERADLSEVTRAEWFALSDTLRGPVIDNPAWSPWQQVANGFVVSPGLRRYIQVRVRFPLPGAALHRLVFEYAQPPLFHDLPAEIYPDVVTPGEETRFTLSAIAYLDTVYGGLGRLSDTGFRYLDVGTSAHVAAVDDVLVDDVPVAFDLRLLPGQGFAVDLGRRIIANGTFLQVKFRASVFRDFTRFRVSARDSSFTDLRYQTGREADVDVDSDGGRLVVRFDTRVVRSLLTRIAPATPVITPNGDGINDTFVLTFTLLHVLKPVDVSLDILDLSGRLRAAGAPRTVPAGVHSLSWDGRDGHGEVLPPGLYLYRLFVDAANGGQTRDGLLSVAY